jgi:phage gp36-like protein
MAYVTNIQLAEKPGALELSQVASSEHGALVDAELMDLTLRGAVRDAYPDEQVATADAALARIEQIVAETDELINAHLVRRVPVLPVFPVPSVLTRIARGIVRYELHKDLRAAEDNSPIVRDYKAALRLLESIRDGKLTLGADDPSTVIDGMQISSNERIFTRDRLAKL